MRTALALAATLALLGIPAPVAAQPGTSITVTLERQQESVSVGQRITISARIVNSANRPTEPLIAHLNVAGVDSAVYVDLEDWTASPTQELPPLPAGGTTSASWDIQAVNVGEFDVYVVLLPKGTGLPAASPPALVQVSGRRTLHAGGALPVIIVVPVLLGILLLGLRRRGLVSSGEAVLFARKGSARSL